MTSPQRLGLVALVGVALVVALPLLTSAPDDAPGVAEGLGQDTPLEPDSAELDGGRQAELTGDLGEAPEITRSAAPVAGSARLSVALAFPPGTPEDPTLAVAAIDAGGSELARAAVDARGEATLAVADLEAVVAVRVDGRFLFLAEDAPTAGRDRIQLEPRLGAWVRGTVVPRSGLPDEPIQGEVELGGMAMGGRRGFRFASQRAPLVDGAFEFRGQDPDLDYSLTPRLEDRHAPPAFGVSPEPGEALDRELVYNLGATIAGRVTDPGGEPVAGARVRTEADMPWPGAPRPETRTDAQGRFRLNAVRAGSNSIEVSREGFRTLTGDAMDLGEGETTEDLVLVLSRGLGFTGRVVYPDQRPAAGASVRVFGTTRGSAFGNPFAGGRRRQMGSGRADSEGRFTISGLEAGAFTLDASLEAPPPADSSPTWDKVTWYGAVEGVAAGSEQVLVLQAPSPFSGTVVDDRGEPIEVFTVTADSTNLPKSASFAQLDALGRFTFDLVPPGEYEVKVSAEGHADSETQLITLPVDQPLSFVLPREMAVHGRVLTPSGDPLASAAVRIEGRGGGGSPWMRSNPTFDCDDEGRFTLTDLAPGPLSLVATAEGWADSEPLELDVAPGVVEDGAELFVRVGGRIEGFVYDSEGDPMIGRRVTWSANAMGMGATNEALTDAAGAFAFENVTPGSWSVTASPSMQKMMEGMSGGQRDPAAFTNLMAELLSETVTVVDGATTEVWLGGTPKVPVVLYGRVTHDGQPQEGLQVTAVREGQALLTGMRSAVSDANGDYELTIDRPGAFVLSARRGTTSGETYADVPVTDRMRIDIRIPNGSISGVVRMSGGRPAVGLPLSLQREDGLGRVAWSNSSTRTSEDGSYTFRDLPAGAYTVRANAAAFGTRRDESQGTTVRAGIVVAEEQATRGVDFQLEASGVVEGKVVDTNGSAVRGATIFFREPSGRLVSQVGTATSGAGGAFREAGLSPGRYSISVRAEGQAANDVATVNVRSGETESITLTVEAAVWLVVTIEDPDGKLLRARVEVLDKEGRDVGTLITPAQLQQLFNQGFSTTEQRLGPVPPGRYTVRATLADGSVQEKRVRVRSGDEEKKITLRVK